MFSKYMVKIDLLKTFAHDQAKFDKHYVQFLFNNIFNK